MRHFSFWRTARHILLRAIAALAVVLVIAALAGFVVVQSGWFHEYVRSRIISEIEHATGARVELGRFSFRGPTLTATVAPLILHGAEGDSEQPLLRIESVTLKLRVLSFSERKIDLASLKLDQPRIHIQLDPEGRTRLPNRSGDWPQVLLDLGVGRYEIADGVLELEDRRVPINLRGEGLAVKLTYDPATPSYKGELTSRSFRVLAGGLPPVDIGLSSQFALEKKRIVVSALRLSKGASHADLKGELTNPLLPEGTLAIQASASLRDIVAMFPIPLAPTGSADFTGTIRLPFADLSGFALSGRLNARGAGYSSGKLHIQDAAVHAQVALTANQLNATEVQTNALGAQFTGRLSLSEWAQLHAEGAVESLSVAQAAELLTPRPLPWNGTLSGTFVADTTIHQPMLQAHASLAIAPAPEGKPIEGRIDATYNQHESELSIADSYIATPSSRLEASGALNRRMSVKFQSSDLNDVLAALPIIEDNAPTKLPIKLNNGSIAANGTVTGNLDDPRFRGQMTIANASLEGHGFDKFDADVDLSKDVLSTSRFTLARGATDISGIATITGAQGNFDHAQVTAQFNLRNGNLEELAKEAGVNLAVKGTGSASARVSGSLDQPRADLTVNIANPQAFGETMDHASAALTVTRTTLDIANGQAADGSNLINFSGSYRPSSSDWSSGELQGQAATRNLPFTRVEALKRLAPDLAANVTADVRGQGRLANGGFSLTSANGNVSAQAVNFRGELLGDVALAAETHGEEVSVTAQGELRTSSLEGSGSWRLSGDENGSAAIRFSRMDLDEVHRLAMLAGAAPHQAQPDLPLEGLIDGGSIALTLPLRQPRDFQATVTLNSVQLNPKPGQTLALGLLPKDVTLSTAQPVIVVVNLREARIQQARLTGPDTNLEINGVIPFSTSTGSDLTVRGGVNLTALQLINPSLLARGNATVEATLRGSLANPALNGRMELKDASVYLKDVPTGLENVTGGVLFNRNRATIDKLTAQLGTGTLALGGFVEFGTPLIYRLQAAAQQVRVRLPIDLSTSLNANLALNGTSDSSTLSGTLTVNRAAFNPHTDLGNLLDAFASPAPEATSSDYLRGMQFDVRVASAPAFVFQTSLTRDVQSEIDLRLRGTPLRPLLQGSVSIDSGQIQVYGNQYTIDRGDIRFTNPVKIEPVFDVALETKVSGVSVNVTFTGTMDKLKTNYSSDPPLESSKIIALLAVGRNPSQFEDATAAQASGSSPNLTGAGGSLLSQALSAQLSSKLQRFFGASRVKIDPTDPATTSTLDSAPQARLTFEQQVSKDVTMTYITNLNYTAEQIVRLQWDFNKNWSAIAVRDANGLFGIDFQYRRRFK